MKRIAFLFAAILTLSLLNRPAAAQDTTLTVTSDGTVGIRTTTPQATLDISGQALIQADEATGSTAGLEVRGQRGTFGPSIALDNGSQQWNIASWSDNSLIFVKSTGTTFTPFTINNNSFHDALVLGANGVGIGTDTPGSRLDVRSDGTTRVDFGTASASDPVFQRFFHSSTLQGGAVGYDTDDDVLKVVKGGSFDHSTAGLAVAADGLVGIGTVTPASRLELSGNSDPSTSLTMQHTAGKWTRIGAGVGGSVIKFDDTGFLAIRADDEKGGTYAGTEVMRIRPDGHVGINTTNPTSQLDVRAAETARIDLTTASETAPVFHRFFYDTSIQGASVGFDVNEKVVKILYGGGFDSSENGIMINANGYVGIGVAQPSHPLQMASGAFVTAGGLWVDASSRAFKDNITDLSLAEARAAVEQLSPVTFSYKKEPGETYTGFIAEDVPELVATANRKGLSAMEIVAVLTKVVQDQQRRIAELEARLGVDR